MFLLTCLDNVLLKLFPVKQLDCPLAVSNRYMTDEEALEVALGNTNVNTRERIADFDPDLFRVGFVTLSSFSVF